MLKLFKRNRYFIVFYDCLNVTTGGTLTGNIGARIRNGQFANRYELHDLIEMANKQEDGTLVTSVRITNLLEVSKSDYWRWLDDEKGSLSYGETERIFI